MEKKDQQGFMLAIGLTLVVMILAQVFLWGPKQKAQLEAQRVEQAAIAEQAANGVPATPQIVDRTDVIESAFEAGGRIPFNAPAVDGSISLKGARLDDLSMKRHFETIKKEEEVHLLSPQGSKGAYFAATGWQGDKSGLPGLNANWKLIEGRELTPSTPLTLQYEASNLTFTRVVEVDEHYMFTYTDTVTNNGSEQAIVRPFGVVSQFGLPDDWKPFYILHEGAVGVEGQKLKQQSYKNLDKGKPLEFSSEGGWIGLTTKYWMTAIVPDQSDIIEVETTMEVIDRERVYVARVNGSNQTLSPGATITYAQRIFSGAKRVDVLNAYQKGEGSALTPVPRFTDAVDWGNFWFFTKPFFFFLNMFNGWFGNFGLAIMALTVLVKLAFFPLQSKAYASMAKMRKLMPEMEKIKEQYKDDRQGQQKAMMELYQREKANPFSGCLPLIPQMFVFYGLYKTLFVTLEMRHEPFFGWIRDLSAPDPTSYMNLFGLLPFDPTAIPVIGLISIGVWPILYGLTMWLLQNLNAPPPDPTQRMMMQFLPIVFTFVFAGFAAGLVIYWTWSNVLSIAQQYYIMRKNGVETQFDKFLKAKFGKGASEEGAG